MSATSCPVGCDSWEFAAKYFGDCVCSRRDALSFTLGCVSIVAWGVAELPQIVANWRNKSSEGVSLAFIATWLTGDAFNLVGCAVSPTLPTQLYTAMLYTATTIVLVAQHLHYTKHSRNVKRETDRTAEDVEGRHAHDDDDIDGDDDDATRGGVDTRPLLGRHRRDASDDAKSDSFFESVGSHFGTTPGSARTFAALGSSSVNTRSHHSIGSHPAERVGSSGRRRPGHHDGGDGRRSSLGSRPYDSPLPPLPPRRHHEPADEDDAGRRSGGRTDGRRSGLTSSLAAAAATGSSLSVISLVHRGGVAAASGHLSRKLLESSSEFIRAPLVKAPGWVGPFLGWTMTAIYLSGRVPQIMRNHTRGSVEGLSVSMFVLAVVGNATYLGSILARSLEWARIHPNLPWIVDAAMCLVMDAVILGQSAWYGGCCVGKEGSGGGGVVNTPGNSGYASDESASQEDDDPV